MKRRAFLSNWIVLFVFVAGTVSMAIGQIIYVDDDAPGLNNGSSWGNAYNYLQDALSVASSGDEIWVAQGIYKPDHGANQTLGDREATFQLINNITIRGGYAGFGEPDPDARDIENYKSILSGDINIIGYDLDNSYHVVMGNGTDETASLDGFTITKGNANGLYMRRYNEAGGFWNDGSPTLINCTLVDNNATKYAGGICNMLSNSTFINCNFIRNRAEEGGAMYNVSGGPTLINCIFSNNSAGYDGGGISGHGSSQPILFNCIFSGNSAGHRGGGMSNYWDDDAILLNCTFSGNVVETGYGGGIANNTCSPKLTNCILWYNMDKNGMGESSQIYQIDGATPVVNYSCIQNWTGSLGGTGNIDFEPGFIQQGYRDTNGIWIDGDYHLLLSSPCINSGDPNYLAEPGETDFDGKPRIRNGIVDMGAYEFGPIFWYVDVINGNDNNNGRSPETAFATIQKGINSAEDGDMVFVYPGVYHETIDFMGKAITVRSAEYPAVLQAQDYFAVWFCSGEGPDSILRNFVIRDSFIAIFISNSSPTISNVTIVDNGFGIAAYTGSQPNISSSIFWNNIYGDLLECQARFSCVQHGCGGEGNLDIDPLFVDPDNGDYHLQSERGRYWLAWDVWILDEAFSPCIDGGDPNADYSNEPEPNGGRVNMGAYGGTAYASMKEMHWLYSDTNKDGWVNLIDFAMIALDWLKYKMGTSNLPPEVSIIKPQDGGSFPSYPSIEIEAEARDSDGSIVWVEFLANGDVIGEDNNGADGWTTNWKAPHGGDYSLTAEATDDDGESATSPAVEIQITRPTR